jgi:MFS family permease
MTATAIAPASSTREKRRVLLAALSGTTIEWYDFYLYGTAAALIFNQQYFPTHSAFASTMASFASLAVGFLARPIGGIIAGHLGDRIGRKSLLVASLLLMGIGSTLIGLVPNFDAIGWWAAAALVALRLVQGLAAGAEWGGSALLSVEHAPSSRRGFFGSFTQIGSAAGMLLATGMFVIVQALTTDEQFEAFGWRIPFLLSAFLVVLGLWIRLGVRDAPEFQQLKDSGATDRVPVVTVFRSHWRPLLVTIAQRIAQNSVYFLITVYVLSYLADTHGDKEAGVNAVMIGSAVGLVTTPFWGWLSDRVVRVDLLRLPVDGLARSPSPSHDPGHERRARRGLRPAGGVVRRAVPRRGAVLGREPGLPARIRDRWRNHADDRRSAVRARREHPVAHLRLPDLHRGDLADRDDHREGSARCRDPCRARCLIAEETP